LHRGGQNLAHWDAIGDLRVLGVGLNREQLVFTATEQAFLDGGHLAQLLEVNGGQWLLLGFDCLAVLLRDSFKLDHAPRLESSLRACKAEFVL